MIPEIITWTIGCFTHSILKKLGCLGASTKNTLMSCPSGKKHAAGTSATSAWKPKLKPWHRRRFQWGLPSGKLRFWTQRFYFQGLLSGIMNRLYFQGLFSWSKFYDQGLFSGTMHSPPVKMVKSMSFDQDFWDGSLKLGNGGGWFRCARI